MKNHFWLLSTVFINSLMWGQVIESLEADIYPEYYSKGVMVEYLGEVELGNFTPALHFMVPAGTDSAFSVVEVEGQKDPIISNLALEKRGNETWVTVTPKNNKFRFFAFYTPFTNPTGERKFDFSIKSDSDFPHYHILVQEPMVAENFKLIEPDDEPESFPDQHGITFHRFHYESLKAGQIQSIEIQYQNPSGKLTMEQLQSMLNAGGNVVAAAPEGNDAPERFTLPTWQPYLALLAMTLVVAFNYKRFPAVAVSKSASKPVSATDKAKASTAGQKKFCSQCGQPVRPNDKFCSSCGHKL